MDDIRFIIPAAGIAARLDHCGYPKELLPLAFVHDAGKTRPILAIEYSLMALSEAQLRFGSIVVSPQKLDIARYVKDGARYGLSVVYSVQPEPTGLISAISTMSGWLENRTTCLALPDTLFKPVTAIRDVCSELRRTDADLVLGVFPTLEPSRLGPVAITADGAVSLVQDKPAVPCAMNTWGIAVWRPPVTNLLNRIVQPRGAECQRTDVPLGSVFNEAVRAGMNVRAVKFDDGCFLDIGTPAGLFEALQDTSGSRIKSSTPQAAAR